MRPRSAQRSALRILAALVICSALIPIPNVSSLLFRAAHGQGQRPERKEHPRPDKPEGDLPNLDDAQNESLLEREPLPPVHSTIRSRQNEGKPWDGRRVGDPDPPADQDQAISAERANGKSHRTERGNAGSTPRVRNHTLRSHASRRPNSPPPVPDNQFVQNFFTWALLRNPSSAESTYWHDQLRVGYAQGQGSLKLAAIEFGRTLFESAEYAARNRNAHWYVYDLYKTYLMRDPDATGWTNWENLVPTHGREYVRRGFEESTEFATLLTTITPNGSPTSAASSLVTARIDPRNQPGNGMPARDANWSVPLLSLPGRAGLDLGLTLSYSSQVWTRSGPYIYFDEDNGFPSPGFRLGFPTVQKKVFDAQTARNAYLLLTGGRRVELRQIGTSNTYDAADSSYLRLYDNGATLLVYSTDGTKMSFTEASGEYRCVEIKDRNGNYITISYNTLGRITTITDTLGRVINFNYDSNANLISITQAWSGQPSHQWVSFGWSTRNMQSSFSQVGVVGTANGTTLPVITQVNLNDTSYFTFDYTNSLQMSVIRNYFGTTERNSTSFTYETPASDVPRLLSSSVTGRNWTGINGVPAQVTTQYSVAGDGACVLTAPDGTIYKEYYGTGWQKGLTLTSEVWSGGVKQKWITSAWTQDNTSVSYETNPRVSETNVYDASGNRRRTTIDYGGYAQWGLPYAVREYAADGTTEIRQTVTDYHLPQPYLDRRIIGLVSQVQLASGGQWQSKVTYTHDDPARLHAVPAAATQHDTSYNLSLTTRGNVTAVSRWDAHDVNNATKKLTSYTNYYNTGTPISSTDPAGHQNSITYADAFSDNINRNTFAYPTTVTDAGGFSSYVQYNFDFGATTRTQSPAPAGQSQGAIQTMNYNSLGQLERVTTTNNGAYKRFWYGMDYVASYTTVTSVADQAYSIEIVDGLGRVIGAASSHPGSSGGYRFVSTIYNSLGQTIKQSNPTEVSSSYIPAGDDLLGFHYTQQTYDWQGRPRVTTNPDSSTTDATYSGCGCAGGAVVTFTDEVGRKQKLYSDVLGRQVKMEVLNSSGTVYSTRTHTYNTRDQVTSVKQYQGLQASGVYQEIIKNYDGYGRVISHKEPIQTTATIYTYNVDSQPVTVTEARGVTQTFTYNSRELPTTVSYSGGTPLAAVNIAYDGAGNRTSMTDGTGSRTYQYNQLSQLTSETRQFNGLSGNFTLSYEYNLVGALKAFTDHVGSRVDYNFNTAGMLTSVTGSGPHSTPTYASNFVYRASGAIKDFDYGNGVHQQHNFNSRLLNTSLSLTSGSNTSTWNYQYYADGKLQKVTDINNPIFDRAFDYDQVGRLTEARTGSEARGGSTPDGPFKQTYSYDVWENTISRTHRLWTENPTTTNAGFNNNRHSLWGYDNEGNLLGDDNASYGYDAAQRQNHFESNLYIENWPSLPVSVLEVSQTFDGNSMPAKKTTTERWTQFIGEEMQVQESISSVYYLRSTVLGGKVIAELNENGAKDFGYVFVGGMQLATHRPWSTSLPFDWASTSPATGSEYRLASSVLDRKELDPLGNDVTYDLGPPIVTEPVFYNSKFDQMPLLIEGGPSAEYEQNNVAWANLVLATIQAARDRDEAESLWQSGKRSEAMAILMKNPNVGIEFRSIYKNEITRRGSYFGKDAADFLHGINIAVDSGLLSPVMGLSTSIGLIGGDFVGSGASQSVLTQDDPETISSEGSKNCRFKISFKAGTFYEGNRNLPNGPGEIQYNNRTYFGLGFTVEGTTRGGGGIGRIGIDVNPNNPKGKWSLDQFTSSYAKVDGKFVTISGRVQQGGEAWRDIDSKGYYFATDWTDRFSRYDHPSLLANMPDTFKNQSFLIKVFRGREVCQAEFHVIQRGNSIHWGKGAQGIWPR